MAGLREHTELLYKSVRYAVWRRHFGKSFTVKEMTDIVLTGERGEKKKGDREREGGGGGEANKELRDKNVVVKSSGVTFIAGTTDGLWKYFFSLWVGTILKRVLLLDRMINRVFCKTL